MFFDNRAKEISSLIKSHNEEILKGIYDIHMEVLKNTNDEVQYFRTFFPLFQSYINNLNILPHYLRFHCRTIEVHQKPVLTLGDNKSCELGDYFINIIYKHNTEILGEKIIIYQHKRTKSNYWKIDQKQLDLLKNWDTFCFGRTINKKLFYKLKPTRPEFGSYILIKSIENFFISNIFGTAYDISEIQTHNRIHVKDVDKFYYSSICAFFNQLIWEIGEPIIPNTEIFEFKDALYKYVGWKNSDGMKFINRKKESFEKKFFGIEILVSREQ